MPDRSGVPVERHLAELAAEVEFPPTPDLAATVGARLRTERGTPRRVIWPARRHRSSVTRVILVAGAVLVMAAATALAASPGARDALLDLIGVGGVRVEDVPDLPPVPRGAPPESGRGTSLAAAQRRIGFELRRIELPVLRRPDRIHIRELDDVPVVSFDFEPGAGLPYSPHTETGLLFTQFRARIDEALLKKLVAGTRVDRVRVGGARGYWLGGGEHAIAYRGERGFTPERLAGNVLVWQDGAITLRVEAEVPKAGALRIARSVR